MITTTELCSVAHFSITALCRRRKALLFTLVINQRPHGASSQQWCAFTARSHVAKNLKIEIIHILTTRTEPPNASQLEFSSILQEYRQRESNVIVSNDRSLLAGRCSPTPNAIIFKSNSSRVSHELLILVNEGLLNLITILRTLRAKCERLKFRNSWQRTSGLRKCIILWQLVVFGLRKEMKQRYRR